MDLTAAGFPAADRRCLPPIALAFYCSGPPPSGLAGGKSDTAADENARGNASPRQSDQMETKDLRTGLTLLGFVQNV